MQELRASIHYERHRWGETAILEARTHAGQEITIKANCQVGEIQGGQSYLWFGRWHEHPKHGKQFHAKTFVPCEPAERRAVTKYLEKAPRVGPVIAGRLWEEYGAEAVRKLREEPREAAFGVRGLSTAGAREAAAWLEERKATEDCSVKLVGLLAGYGFPRDLHKALTALHGNRAAAMVRKNPYLLKDFPRCGFAKCDRLYLDLGLNPNRRKRQALCMAYGLESDPSGNTWYPVAFVERTLAKYIGPAERNGPAAASLAKRAGLLRVRRTQPDNQPWFADAGKADNEGRLAARVAEMFPGRAADWGLDGADFPDMSDHQNQILRDACRGPLALFGGGPGTGKTYSIARLIRYLRSRFGESAVAIAAPFGKAAVRLMEVLHQNGCTAQVSTIHSLLAVAPAEDGGGWEFQHNADNPLPCRFLFLEEMSTCDTDLAAAVFDACAPGTHVMLIGDIGQLPPVGHGAPLRDLIRAGFPYGELQEIRRNSGTAVRACHMIRTGRPFPTDDRLELPEKNLRFIETRDNEHTKRELLALFAKLAAIPDVDPIRDVQVIVAVNRKSCLSRKALNPVLQDLLNPTGRRVKGSPFRVGDKVVNTKNGWFPLVDGDGRDDGIGGMNGLDIPFNPVIPSDSLSSDDGEEKVWVANGEQGRVVDVAERVTTVELDAPRRAIKVPRGQPAGSDEDDETTDTGCTWDLAYTITTHKAQGSEWPIVITLVDDYPGARMVCSREWLYTALSRLSQFEVAIGQRSTAMDMVRRPALDLRKTFLVERIAELVGQAG